MKDRKANLLITMVFDKDFDIRKQINTELELKDEITKDLQHLITGKEIKHFIVADDEVINEKLTQERKVGKWTGEEEGYYSECSCCGASFLWEDYKYLGDWKYCPKCGAKLER